MPTTFNDALQWALLVGLSPLSSVITGAILKVWQDRTGQEMNNVRKEYISYIVPFAVVTLAYGAQLALGYATFNVDKLFSYIISAGIVVGFGSNLTYTMYKGSKQPTLLEGISVRTVDPWPQPMVQGVDHSWREPEPKLPDISPDEAASRDLQWAVQERGVQPRPRPPIDNEE